MTEFGDRYGSFTFDIDSGIEPAIASMLKILKKIGPERANRLQEGYSDVFRNVEFSSDENKEFLFQDLVAALDLSSPAGWRFGPEESFSVTYCFVDEDLIPVEDVYFD